VHALHASNARMDDWREQQRMQAVAREHGNQILNLDLLHAVYSCSIVLEYYRRSTAVIYTVYMVTCAYELVYKVLNLVQPSGCA
jgi:hypothetical protein